MTGKTEQPAAYCAGKDFLLKPDGSAYHLGTKAGEVHPRIVVVETQAQAEIVAQVLDTTCDIKEVHSEREMHTYSGSYKNVPISVIAIGRGSPMMDFFLREAVWCYQGPMAIVRLGTCILLDKDVAADTVMCADLGSVLSFANYSHHTGAFNKSSLGKGSPAYLISKPSPSDAVLSGELQKRLAEAGLKTKGALCACVESFGAQGERDPHYEDENYDVLPELRKAGVQWMDNELHQLFYLASKRNQICKTAGCSIGVLNRDVHRDTILQSDSDLRSFFEVAGRAAFEALLTSDV